MTAHQVLAELNALLLLPRAQQPAAVLDLRERIPAQPTEQWNSAFGENSLFSAFTQTSVAAGVYRANRAALAPVFQRAEAFRIVEIGGGDGRLWQGLVPATAQGEVVVVDPHPEATDGVRRFLPPQITIRHLQCSVASAELPSCDAVISSLTLHHVAGRSAAERASVGMAGNGKLEILRACRAAIQPRTGLFLLSEADVFCDVSLAPNDPVLTERLVDSYVRRFALSVAHDAVAADNLGLAAQLVSIVRDWGLAQVAAAGAALVDRDVYELDVSNWIELLESAGFRIEERRFTDEWNLFCHYRCR